MTDKLVHSGPLGATPTVEEARIGDEDFVADCALEEEHGECGRAIN